MIVKRAEKAHAKINLTLAVGRLRDDGYHEVATVLHMLELCDTVQINATRTKQTIPKDRLSHGDLEVDVTSNVEVTANSRDNLAYKAVRLLEKEIIYAGYNKVNVHIEKNIPLAAGLAGGSADAGAVLRGLAQSLSLNISTDELLRRAEAIGSDVPACLSGGTVLGTGRGEKIIRLDAGRYWWVLANPGGQLSAGAVYSAFSREQRSDDPLRHDGDRWGQRSTEIASPEFLQALASGEPSQLAPFLTNDLQPSVIRLHPGVEPLLHMMQRRSECRHLLRVIVSGSGPTVVGLAEDRSGAEVAARFLKQQGVPWVWWGESEVHT